MIYWGDASGAVRSHLVSGSTTVHQSPTAGRRIGSVSFDGARVLWTDCGDAVYPCIVRKRQAGTTTVVSSGPNAGPTDVQGDAAAMFWGGGSVMKYVH